MRKKSKELLIEFFAKKIEDFAKKEMKSKKLL